MMGYPVGDSKTASTSPMQKQSVMIMTRPKKAFIAVDQTIAFGNTLPASFSSSAMCAPASGHKKHHKGVVMPTRVERPLLPQPPRSSNLVKTSEAEA